MDADQLLAIIFFFTGSVAQSVEQRTFNPLVASSNLARPTSNTEGSQKCGPFSFGSVECVGSFYFDIKVTDETNTKDEKALYIKEAFAGFERILGNIHEESYIYVQDVRAASYGFGGKTQEFRYHQ